MTKETIFGEKARSINNYIITVLVSIILFLVQSMYRNNTQSHSLYERQIEQMQKDVAGVQSDVKNTKEQLGNFKIMSSEKWSDHINAYHK